MSAPDLPVVPAGTLTYTPGYRGQKRVMLLAGLIVLLLGVVQLWTPLRLVLAGVHAKAETVRIVKEKTGLPPIVLTNDAQVLAQLEPRDRSWVFWNEFRFKTIDDQVVEVRANVGGQLKPIYMLSDADGLPTTDTICYDPARPEQAILPFVISTWLAPVVLVLMGLAATIVGAVLLYWADKPIELPHILAAGTPPRPDEK